MINKNEKKPGLVVPIIIFAIGAFIVFNMFYKSPRDKLTTSQEEVTKLTEEAAEKQTVKISANNETKLLATKSLKNINVETELAKAGLNSNDYTVTKNGYKVKTSGPVKKLAQIVTSLSGSLEVNLETGQLIGSPPVLQLTLVKITPTSGTSGTLTFQASAIR